LNAPKADQQPGKSLLPHTTLSTILGYRDAAIAAIDEAIDLIQRGHEAAAEALGLAESAYGAAVFHGEDRSKLDAYRRLFESFDPDASKAVFREQTDARVWMNLMALTGLDALTDRTAKEDLYRSLCADVPEATEANVLATFEHYRSSADLIFQRGLARCFSDLDRRFKSHDGFKIGSRIVLTNAFDGWGMWQYSSRVRETITDVERVMAVLAGRSKDYEIGSIVRAVTDDRGHGYGARRSTTEGEFFRVRSFMNGNAHLWFTDPELVTKANLVLADYYGDVLPDGVDADVSHEDLGTNCTALAKDLSYYWTPTNVITRLLDGCSLSGARVLEPSAGTGHIVRELLLQGAIVDAVEVHPERVRALSKASGPTGLKVHACNFLTRQPEPIYDYVIMNPPFYGTHWMKHIRHAFEFLKPRGTLRAVVPIGAELNEGKEHVAFRKWANQHNDCWGGLFTDLPPESFAESGTRINTLLLTLRKGN